MTLYYRIHDAELYGGPGSIGYASQAFTITNPASLDEWGDETADLLRAGLAKDLHVAPENLEYITAAEYEVETEEDDDDEDDCW